jgi:hypothetical protein
MYKAEYAKSTTLEAYFISEALFEMIMTVPVELQVRKIEAGAPLEIA